MKESGQTMRIGYVVKRYPRYSETFVVNEILAHEAAGLDIEIFALRGPCDTHFQDIISRVRASVHYLHAEGLRAVGLWDALQAAANEFPNIWPQLALAHGEDVREVYQSIQLARAVRDRGITHLHAHFATSAATVARLAARFAAIPYTFTAHAKDIYHQSVRPDDLERKLRDAAAVITVSDYNHAHLSQTYGRAAAQVRRIYNGLDLERFPYAAPQRRAPSIIAVGRLIEKKGFADLIEACALLHARGLSYSCRIIGAGELQAPLQAQIERLGLRAQVQLLGPRPQSEVIRLMQHASVFAAPCVVAADNNQDGLPTVLLEAMALGTPCVATPVTGIPEAVRHNESGLMVPQHDPMALAAALEALLTNTELRMRLAACARRLIETEFDVRHNTAHQRELFEVASHSGCSPLRHAV